MQNNLDDITVDMTRSDEFIKTIPNTFLNGPCKEEKIYYNIIPTNTSEFQRSDIIEFSNIGICGTPDFNMFSNPYALP
ncbi:hypothetical protein M8J76_002377 [Diaphorina citri]|nr:hypothetical protein M8J75_009701 [Diaphorina citri]KAI5722015.1 hypothetical protein M8J76_002377 [Diaphorina citri]